MNAKRASVVLIVFAVAGVSLYLFSTSKNIPPQTPSEVASAFYKSYQGCLKNPPGEASGQVSVYCQNHTGFTTPDFSKNIDAGGIAKLGADPIACAQNPPQNFLASDANIIDDGKTAMVVVKEFFGGSRLDIRVYLRKIDSQWKIDNVACPWPDPAAQPETVASWATYTNENSRVSFRYPVSAGSNFAPVVKTTATGTEVAIQTIGLELKLVIQPLRPGLPKYFGDSIFQESNTVGTNRWDVSLSTEPPFVAYQTTRDNMRYIFIFPHETEKNAVQETVLSTFTFLNPQEATVTAKIGEKKSVLGISITPQEVLEDSRCPEAVQCIQAGTVRLKTMLEGGMGTAPQVFVLNKTVTTETEEVTLIDVTPLRGAGETISPSEYQFVFQVKKRT